MIFALDLDDGGLLVYSTQSEAVSDIEGIDVEDVPILFFSEDGAPLEAKFDQPNERGRFSVWSSTYTLHPAVAGKRQSLQDCLGKVKYVEGGDISTVAQVASMLQSATANGPLVANDRE
jgi:hypothetical protein